MEAGSEERTGGDRLKEMMNDLRRLLGEQVESLKTLERTIQEQKKYLTERDVEGIISSITEQGQCLERVHRMDREQKRLMETISNRLGRGGTGAMTLSSLADDVDAGTAKELRATGEAMRVTLSNIGRVNRENRRLIEHSLRLVREMLGAATGTAPDIPTYGSGGTLTPHRQDRMLVDRKT